MGGTTGPLRWGRAPLSLVPAALRKAWADDALPAAVCLAAGLPAGTTLDQLDESCWAALAETTVPPALERYLLSLVTRRQRAIGGLPLLMRPWPRGVPLVTLPWRMQTRASLAHAGIFDGPTLAAASIGTLLYTRGIAARTFLEVTTLPEYALARLPSRSGREDTTGDGATTGTAVADAPQVQAATLEAALPALLAALTGEEGIRLAALVRHLGWDGAPPLALAEAAALAGMSSTRLRALGCARLARVRPVSTLPVPVLERALEVLRNAVPVSASHAAALLVDAGLALAPFNPATVLAVARFVRLDCPLVCAPTPSGDPLVLAQDCDRRLRPIISRLERACVAVGVLPLAQMQATLRVAGTSLDAARIPVVLQAYSRALQPLPGAEDWLWTPARRGESRLDHALRAMLTAAPALSVRALRGGLERRWRRDRWRDGDHVPVPPAAVLEAYCRAHPAFAQEPDGRICLAPDAPRVALGAIEESILTAMAAAPQGMLTRAEVPCLAHQSGLRRDSIEAALRYSPLLQEVRPGCWTRRDDAPEPVPSAPVRRLLDAGCAPQGGVWMEFVVGPRRPQLQHLPATLRAGLCARRYAVVAPGVAEPLRAITINAAGLSWGYDRFLRATGAVPGDRIHVHFDPCAGQAYLTLRPAGGPPPTAR